MKRFILLRKSWLPASFLWFLGFFPVIVSGQTPITHNIGSGSLVIQGSSTDDYYVTGTTSANKIIVGSGYHGVITLDNVTITSNTTSTFSALCGNGTNVVTTASCIAIMGLNGQSNLSPVTEVDLVLTGTNLLTCNVSRYCGIQVDQGAQIHIGASDPNDNSSGILETKATHNVGAAGIGAIHGGYFSDVYNGDQGIGTITSMNGAAPSGCTNYPETGGGNVIISSGTITAWGGHSAGIGGGFRSFYNGVIIITGGIIDARSRMHAAGIGSGCPTGTGVVDCFAENSTIIVLPPAQITSYGVASVLDQLDPDLGLAGTKNLIYINDPNKTLITVFTEDTLPNANIYLDLTQMQNVVNIFNSLGLGWYDLTKVRIGRTDATTGMFDFHAELQQSTTFFTDASSINPATLGRPYMPETRVIVGTAADRDTVILLLLPADISFTDYPSTPLEVGYTSTEAIQNAFCTKVSYNDAVSLTGVTYVLQDGIDFTSLIFLGPDSSTVISPPSTINNGDVFYIIFPIDIGRPLGVYSDVLLIDGVYGVTPLPGYIRKIGMQRVVFDDSYDNDYIRVTASPNQFTTAYPTTDTVILTLNIDHTGTGVLYDYLDVVAMYLVTPIADYDLALAANPLYSSGWKSLNVPLTNNGNATTTVDFTTMPAGTYYIHWYVESGVAYAHSLTVTSPPRLYGGFGPYTMRIECYKQVLNCSEVDTIDVATLIPSLPCSLSSLSLSVNSPSAKGATTAVVDKKIVYTFIPNFVGVDTVYYTITCGAAVYEGLVRLMVVDCPDNIINVSCFVNAPPTIWDIGRKAVSNVEVHALATPFVGDLDGDGRIEVVVPNNVGYPSTANAILILDDSLKLIRTISPPTPMPNYGTMSLAIADVDNDGLGEIVVATTDLQLLCYSHLGVLKWTTTAPYAINTNVNDCISLIVADINGDGYCEILASNNIYAGESGFLLATLPAGGRGYAEGGPSSFMPVFADIDNDGALEVVAGNTVYKVTITNRSGTAGNSAVIFSQINLPDGFTSVADINLDGRPDIIVTGGHATTAATAIMYVWDGLTGMQIGDTIMVSSAAKRISRAFAGDITGNGRPDIAFTYTLMVEAYEYNEGNNKFDLLWQKSTTDASGATTMSMFDFNQDGEVELVYRDQDSLRIINKLGNNIITFPCSSATHTEYPVIVDIDKDGSADILVSGGTDGYTGTRIIRYSSVTPNQWASARSVWNQHAYNAVHINEDLSVPRYQLNPATVFPGVDGILGTPDDVRPFNAFLQQQTILNINGDQLWRAPDVTPVQATGSAVIDGDSILFTLTVTNIGDAVIGPPLHYTLYKESIPTGYIMNDSIPVQLNADSTITFTFKVAISDCQPAFKLFVRINDKSGLFPYQLECDDGNNVIEFTNPALHQLMTKDAVLLPSFANNGTLANPVSVLFRDTVQYEISVVNANLSTGTVIIRDTLPIYLKHVFGSVESVTLVPPVELVIDTGAIVSPFSRDTIRWRFSNVPSMATRTVRFKATPLPGSVASQPLFDNRAWAQVSDTLFVPTNYTWHQGASVSVVTFSAGFGGSIYQAMEQVLDYRTSPNVGIVIAPDKGYRFIGWSHPAYLSLRGEVIPAQSDIMRYDTLTVYGNVTLQACFEAEIYPIRYFLNGGYFPASVIASNEATCFPFFPASVIARNEAIYSPFLSSYTIESQNLTLIAPEKAGDEFIGWTGTNGDEPQLTVTIPHGSTGEKVFFANYLLSGSEEIDVQPLFIPSDDQIWAVRNELFVRTTQTGSILRIYSIDGVLQRQQVILQAGETKYKLSSGIYIVTLNNGIAQKVVVN